MMAAATDPHIAAFHSASRCQHQHFFLNLSHLRNEAKFTDFKILVRDREIACHRNVLYSSSAYFAAMLDQKSVKAEVRMDGMDYDLLLAMVKYFYGDGITVPWENIKACYQVSHLFQQHDLTHEMEQYIIGHISANNAIGWFKFAEKVDARAIARVAKEHMFDNVAEVCASDDFKEFTLEEIVNFVNSENIECDNHDAILTGCVEWIDFNPVARKDAMFQIIKNVDLGRCSAFAIQTLTKKYADLFTDLRVIKLMFNNILERQVEVEGIPDEQILICGGVDEADNTNNTCWLLPVNDKADKDFETLLDIPEKYIKDESQLVTIPGGFVVCDTSKTYMYNIKSKKWTELPDSPVETTESSVLYWKGLIFKLGGQNGENEDIDSVYCLDLKKNKWSKCADMLIKQGRPIAACSNDQLYVVYNDHNGRQKPVKFQSHQLGSDEWSYKADLPPDAPGTCGASLVSMDDKPYLVGGQYRICAQYSIVEDGWTLLTQCLRQHWNGAAVRYGDSILLCGGYDDDEHGYTTNQIESYNPSQDKWQEWDLQLPKPLWFHNIGRLRNA